MLPAKVPRDTAAAHSKPHALPKRACPLATFSKWEFRTKLEMKTTKEEDKDKISSHFVEALHGQAASMAQNLGTEVLSKEDGPEMLLEALRKEAFPRMDREARELLT